MKKYKRLNLMYEHISNNKKEYILVTLIFIIGIFFGVMFINNVQESTKTEIITYFNNFIEKFKSIEKLDNIEMIKTLILQNSILAVTLWFLGTTVIRHTNSIWNYTL